MLTLATNKASLVAQRNLNQTNKALGSSLEKLSSGLRVNRASDDAASMAIGSRLNAELVALRTVSRNAGQAVSLLQIAEGAMARTSDILVRMKSLAAQAANGTLSETERELLDIEFQELIAEVERLANDTKFNNEALLTEDDTLAPNNLVLIDGTTVGNFSAVELDGSNVITFADAPDGSGDKILTFVTEGPNPITYTGTINAQYVDTSGVNDVLTESAIVTLTNGSDPTRAIIAGMNAGFNVSDGVTPSVDLDLTNPGADRGTKDIDFRIGSGSVQTEDVIETSILAMTASQLGLERLDIQSIIRADGSAAAIDQAINYVIDARANVGSSQNRIETARTNLATNIENTEAARSSYLDADIAAEVTRFTSQQILLQSGISTLAQANRVPESLLALFE